MDKKEINENLANALIASVELEKGSCIRYKDTVLFIFKDEDGKNGVAFKEDEINNTPELYVNLARTVKKKLTFALELFNIILISIKEVKPDEKIGVEKNNWNKAQAKAYAEGANDEIIVALRGSYTKQEALKILKEQVVGNTVIDPVWEEYIKLDALNALKVVLELETYAEILNEFEGWTIDEIIDLKK